MNRKRLSHMTPVLALPCAACLLPLARSAMALEGVDSIVQVWTDSIAAQNYQAAGGDHQTALEGVFGGVRYGNNNAAPWSWVRGLAKETTYTRWVNTSMWGGNGISSMYCMNANYSYMRIPRGYHYYMSGFCYNPPDSVDYPPESVPGPSNPKDRGAAAVSGVYLTPVKYDYPPNGQLTIYADIWLTMGLAW